MQIRFPLQSTRARVAAFMSLLFLAAFGVSGLATWLALTAPVDESAQARLLREVGQATTLYATHKAPDAVRLITERERRPSGYNFRITDPAGRRLAGDLPEQAYAEGFTTLRWQVAATSTSDDDVVRIRVLTARMADGALLSVGEDLERSRQLQSAFLRTFILTSGAALFIALAVGLSYVTRILRRIEVIAGTADAVSTSGEMGLRAPVRPPERRDDIDQLAMAMNRMLDEIQRLVVSVRQVSDDVAHDLRTPLAHLRQRVEVALAGPPDAEAYRAALEGAVEKIDDVLTTFEALLRIGQLEAGANLAAFQPVDVSEIARQVVEAYRPSAEDADHALELHAPRPEWIAGEKSLVTQMLANFVENALIHTPAGSTLEIRVEHLGKSVRLTVEDDGPGVPDADRAQIFRRFYRVERSRTTPGSGLGLSLASAVAHAHGADIRAEDAGPGLRIVVDFPVLATGPAATSPR
jgi:signal transduction histidine kinase